MRRAGPASALPPHGTQHPGLNARAQCSTCLRAAAPRSQRCNKAALLLEHIGKAGACFQSERTRIPALQREAAEERAAADSATAALLRGQPLSRGAHSLPYPPRSNTGEDGNEWEDAAPALEDGFSDGEGAPERGGEAAADLHQLQQPTQHAASRAFFSGEEEAEDGLTPALRQATRFEALRVGATQQETLDWLACDIAPRELSALEVGVVRTPCRHHNKPPPFRTVWPARRVQSGHDFHEM